MLHVASCADAVRHRIVQDNACGHACVAVLQLRRSRRRIWRSSRSRSSQSDPDSSRRATRWNSEHPIRLDYEYPYFQYRYPYRDHRYPYRDYRYRYCDCRYPYCATVLIIVVFPCPCAAVHQRETASCSDRPRSAAGGGRECAERPAAWRRCGGRDPTKGRPHGRAERSKEPRLHTRAYPATRPHTCPLTHSRADKRTPKGASACAATCAYTQCTRRRTL
jgi:hypothetical protein